MTIIPRLTLSSLVATLLMSGLGVSKAQNQQLYTPPATPLRDNTDSANGAGFTVGSSNVVVSHLGYYTTDTADTGTGLKHHHQVGLYRFGTAWNPSGSTVYLTNCTLLRDVDVPAAIKDDNGHVTNSYYLNKYYWVQLDPPMILPAGSSYLLLAQSYNADGDSWVDKASVTWNGYYVGSLGNGSTRAAWYGPGGTTWPLPPTTRFTRNGLGSAYCSPQLGNIAQGPAKVALLSTNTVTLIAGQTLNLTGYLAGASSITAQWWQDGTSVSTQNDATTLSVLSIPNVTNTHSGVYYFTATNSLDGQQSANISVIVYTSPTNLVVSPVTYGQTQTLFAGASANFAITAVTGVSPFTYLWYTNGVLDDTVTGTSYSLINAQASSPTTFTCVVTNSAGSATNTWNISVVPQPTTAYPAVVMADAPIGYWRLNEPDNNLNNGNYNAVANDYWGGNSGVYSNTVLGQAGYGQGLASQYGFTPATDPETSALFRSFPTSTTSNSYVGTINGVNFATPTNNSATFSVEAWVNGPASQISAAGIVTKGYGAGGEQFDIDYAGAFRFYIRDAGGVLRGGSLPAIQADGNWHHVVGVVDEPNSNIFLYVDSQFRATWTCSPSNGILSTTQPMSIGARRSTSSSPYDLQFAGNINDVAIYNYALSSNQVFNHYTAAGIGAHFVAKPVATTNINQGTELVVPAAVVGTLPVSCQWYDVTGGYPGTPLAGQTNPTLDIPNIQAADFNGHTLALITSNSYGSATNELLITVYTVPFFTQQVPAAVTLYSGGGASWTVATVGPQPIGYNWLSNGVPIDSATNVSFTLTNARVSALYSCWATNSYGSSTSSLVSVTVLPAPGVAYPAAVLADNPLGYWRLNESDNTVGNNGAIANDYWGGHFGVYSNTVLGKPGFSSGLATQYGYTPALDPADTSAQFGYYPAAYGTSNYVANISNVDFATPTNNSANFSVEAWVNGDPQQNGISLNAAGIVAKGAWAKEQFTIDTGGATPSTYYYRFTSRDAGGTFRSVGTNTIVPDGLWHHLVGVMDQSHSNLCLYVDGVKVATTTCSPSNGVLSSSVPVSIGTRLNSGGLYAQQFFGSINDVALYNYALRSNQVVNHYLAAGIPPSFTLQPPGYTNVNEGTTLVVRAQVFGSSALSYQWYDNSLASPIPGQTSNTLVIPNISQAQYDGHSLSLIVSNNYGQVTSSSILLSVAAGPPNSVVIAPSLPPAMYVGLPITFTATAQGTQPFGYIWQVDGTTISQATSSAFTYTNLPGTHTIACTVTNSVNSAGTSVSITGQDLPADGYATHILGDSPVAFLRLDEPPYSSTANDYVGGHNAYYYGTVNGLPGFSPAFSAETASGFGMNGTTYYSMAYESDQSSFGPSTIDFSLQGANAHFSIEAWVNVPAGQISGAGIISKGSGGGGEQFNLDVYGGHFRFFVRNALNNGTRTAQSPNIGADGTWHHLVGVCDEANSAIRLYVDGVLNASGSMVPGEGLLGALPLGGPVLTSIGSRMANASDYSFTNQLINAVVSQVAMYDYALSSPQISAHYLAASEPPAIYVQPSPADYKRYEGPSLQYSAAASGYPPLAYQWYKNGAPLSGQTTNTLDFASTAASDSGAYDLVVTNLFGATTSSVVTLTVLAPATPYENQMLANGAGNYWRFNETNGTAAYDYIGGLNASYGASTIMGEPGPSAPDFAFEADNMAVGMNHGVSGSSAYVTAPALNYNTATFTISAWVYPFGPITNYQGVVFTRASTYAKGINYIAVPGRNNMIGYSWNQNNGNTWGWVSGLVTPPGQWSFVALTIAPNQAVMYVGTNGVLRAATNAIAHTVEAWNGATLIGADTATTDRTFMGAMDEVAVFNSTLSASQISNLYWASLPPVPDVNLTIGWSGGNLVLGWPQGTLQASPTVNGTYTNVPSATPPSYTVPPAGTQMFYRVRVR